MSNIRLLPVTAALLFAVSTPAMATIIMTVPDIVFVTPPDVSLDQTESDVEIKGFDERQCISLNYDLMTDQGRILETTPFSCHLFHADPETTAMLIGRAAFDQRIIGVISDSAALDASDGPCGLPGVVYPIPGTEPFRGLEGTQPSDFYRVSNNRRRIEISVDIPSYSDQVRVLTECGD